MKKQSLIVASLSLLFFASGATSLVYQVLWTRLLAVVVGSTSLSMTCTFSVFIFCLSLGGLWASRIKSYHQEALRMYAGIEALIGLLGFLLTLLLLQHDIFLAGLVQSSSPLTELFLKGLLSLVLMGAPTFLMGATLPLVANAIQSLDIRKHVTTLYGVNLLGAACGALTAGFVAIWTLGIMGTAAANLAIALCIATAAFLLSSYLPVEQARETHDERPKAIEPTAVELKYLLLAFSTGVASLSYEVLWGRIAKLYLGERTMAVASLLFVYLSCLAIGSFITPWLARRVGSGNQNRVVAIFALFLAVAAASHLISINAMVHVLNSHSINEFLTGRALPRVALTFLALVIPVTTLGIAFPFLLKTASQLEKTPGLVVGKLYFVNALGSTVGAFFGGYFAPRWFGTLNGMLVTSIGLTAVACGCLWLSVPKLYRLKAIVATGCIIVVCWSILPESLHFVPEGEVVVDAGEDEYGIQLVTRKSRGELKVRNNRIYMAYMLGPLETNFAQEMISYYSCLLARRCENIINIGTGYGISAGVFSLFSSVKEIQTVEILPYVCRNQELFRDHNFAYFEDPRVTLVCGDGLVKLVKDDTKYDVISVNVNGPYTPGSSSLFTVDFWKEALEHLNAGGVYSQLIWGPDRDLLLKGMMSVFPSIIVLPGYSESYNVVAFAEQIELTVHNDRITNRVREALVKFGIQGDKTAEAYFRFNVVQGVRLTGDLQARLWNEKLGNFHSKNWPILEYRLAN